MGQIDVDIAVKDRQLAFLLGSIVCDEPLKSVFDDDRVVEIHVIWAFGLLSMRTSWGTT